MRITSHVSIESEYSGDQDSGKERKFQIADLTNVTGNPTNVPEWGLDVTAYLVHLRIEKNIYKPNRLEGTIMTNSTDKTLPDIIAASLIEGKITVWQENGDQKYYIAQNYLIHEVNPEVRTVDYNFIKVHFVAYSPDVMLTYDKYSMAYATKRLCKDIIPSQLGDTLSSVYSADNFVTDTLQNTSLNNKEIVVPYLMQYNESFYDFLRRVTYRSGEYMYYEGGKLHVGMTEPADSDIPVVNYIMKQGKVRHNMRYSTKTIMSHSSNVNSTKKDPVYAASPSYNEEFSQEEYALMLQRDPNVDKWAQKATTWTGLVIDILSQNSVFDAIKTGAKDVLTGKLKSMKSVKSDNKNYDKKYLFSESDKKGKGDFYDVDKDSATKYTPYMMYYSITQLMANAYHEIRKGEDVVASGMQHIQLHPEIYTHLALGEVIRVEENGTEYVVVHIERTEDADARDHVKVSYYADIVPLLYENIRILPPHQDDIETVRSVGPQHAYVVSNDDPGNLGRMTVRFHWQTENGDATLPLRQSQQMASAGAGFRFQPEVGDEVIVNFTNGNADLPYIAGALYNKAHSSPSSVRTIRSFHGHSITFDDSGDDTAFRKALLPMWGTVENWISLDKNEKLATLKEQLEKTTKDCKAALKDLKGDKTDASLVKYQELCDGYAYRKTFHDKAKNVTLGNNVYSDDEIMNKRYELQYSRTGETISKVEGKDGGSKQNVVDKAISTVDAALDNVGKAITNSAKDTNVAREAYAEQVVQYKKNLQDKFDKLGIIASAVANAASSSDSSDKSTNITMTPLYTYSEADGSNKLYALRTEIKRKQQAAKEAKAKLDDLKKQKDNGVEQVDDKSIDDAIKAQQAVYNDIDNYINKTDAFLKNAMAIPESDVVSDAASDDMRYDTYKHQEHDKYTKADQTDKTQWLPSDQELANVTEKNGKLEQLQYLIDQDTNQNVCQDIYQPDSSYTNQSDKYQKFCSTYKNMKEVYVAYTKLNTKEETKDLTYHTGGITISDDAGLYSMKFDATKRAISMSCPLGSVTMNALTGITISAPNGDVKIAGKNISLVAGNNITVDAGGNRTIVEKTKKAQKELLTAITGTFTDPKVAIEETKDLAIDTFNTVFDDTVSTALSLIPENYQKAAPVVPVDMTALRCVYECLIKPVEGTVKLHTTNNILLEAGGGKTTVDMSSIKSKYNQRQVYGNRSASIAYTVKSLNNMFDEIYALAKSAPASQKKAADDLRKYIWTVSKAKDGTTQSGIWKGLKANWSKDGADDAAKIINGIIESEKGRDPEKDGDLTLKREQVYQTPSGGKSLSDLEEASKKKVRTKPQGDDEAVLFRSVHDAEAALKEIDKAKGLIEALSKVLANPGFKDKGKEIAKYPTVLLKDLGVDKTMYKDIGKEVQEYTLVEKNGTLTTMYEDKPVTANHLLKIKRKYFMQVITKMTEGETSGAIGSFLKTAIFGSSPADFAYVNNETGTLPPLAGDALADTKAWNSMVDLLKATSTDKNKVASFINEHITSPISKTLGIANVISFVGNVHGLMDEYSAQSVEAQGQIYMTSKGGKSTVKLKDKQFVESASYSSKFEDIQTYLKAEITEPAKGAAGPTLLDLKLFSK